MLNRLTIRLILQLKKNNSNINTLSRELKSPYCYIHETLHKLEKLKLINIHKEGKLVMFDLTEDGLEVRRCLFKINEIFYRNK